MLSRDVDPPGRLEFRLFQELGCLIASIHGFAPTLPWWIYANTQARIHLLVMRAFSAHLRTVGGAFVLIIGRGERYAAGGEPKARPVAPMGLSAEMRVVASESAGQA